MNLGHLYFDIVSDFVLRISYFASLGIFTTVEESLQIKLFLQNEPKFRKSQVNVNKVLTRHYEQMDTWSSGKKQSQTNPNKAKSKKAKMNVTSILTESYENKTPIRAPKKQSQTSKRQKPMQPFLPKRIMKKPCFRLRTKQTQFKPNFRGKKMLDNVKRPNPEYDKPFNKHASQLFQKWPICADTNEVM